MSSLSTHLASSLRLYFRNRIALLYGYLFPTIFTVAFWVLYRHEEPALARHMGELLTVTALSGCCFGLPTTLVSERERGVWRRYRLAPVSTGALVAGTAVARWVLVITAALLQVALAMAIGMPLPAHPLELFVAFTFVTFAFVGMGLVIATLADNVPAVQALGQCIFLPMLIIGGVAVRLSTLPAWAQHLSAFFPGRYAVDAIQSTVTGDGLSDAAFSLLALVLIGIGGILAGTMLFRWDAQQRFFAREGKGWVMVALLAWIAVGGLAEARGIVSGPPPAAQATLAPIAPGSAAPTVGPDSGAVVAPIAAADSLLAPDTLPGDSAAPGAPPVPGVAAAPVDSAAVAGRPWRAVTMAQIERDIDFVNVPPDDGVVAPVATVNDALTPEWSSLLDCMRGNIQRWAPARAPDPVQRVRNVLIVSSVPDVLQMEMERWIPLVSFERLQADIPRDELVQLLYWVATHPADGDLSAMHSMRAVCLDTDAPQESDDQVRERVSMYAVKLLGRLTGKLQQR